MEYSNEELKNINKTFNKKGKKYLDIPQIFFTNSDINKLQEWASNRYTNWNGGFGITPGSDYMLKYKIENKFEFTFATDKQLREDIANFGKNKNYEFNNRNFIEKLNWLELIIFICKFENIQFRYDPSIIDEIIKIK